MTKICFLQREQEGNSNKADRESINTEWKSNSMFKAQKWALKA